MELSTRYIAPGCFKNGREVFDLISGEKVRVQKYVDGQIADVLEEVTVPEGKQWSVRVIVEITETDV